jgi:NAD(P)-dependent dehydrogenase (short-subunit alcohol dehydrogenase family)
MDFAGKVAIVTGAGQGIGKVVAEMLARRGAAVAVLDIDPERAGSVASAIQGAGGKAMACVLDLANKSEVDRMVADVVNAFGRVDVLINNAGWTRNQPFVEDTPDYWDRVIDVNYKAQIYTCRAVLEPMIKAGGGAIVNVASDAARVGSPRQCVYAGAKAAVIGFSKALVTEVSKHKIRVNVVSPSTTDTPLTRQALTPEQIERREKAIPLGRIGQPEDQANAIVFFASDAAGYVTGQILSVNGGSSRPG